MAVQGHPPAADRIDQLPTILEVQACTPGVGHIQGLRVQGHLGGWVPEVGVPGHPVGLKSSDQICRPSGVARFRRLMRSLAFAITDQTCQGWLAECLMP